LPLSPKFTARVVVVDGAFAGKINNWYLQKTDDGKQLMEFLQYIDQNEFWKAQIAQIDINSAGELQLFPQVGSEVIDFGKAVDYDKKLRKLMAFYKEIVPVKGWNKYQKVTLKYKDQIICE
jgi:cell division protein FtsQ